MMRGQWFSTIRIMRYFWRFLQFSHWFLGYWIRNVWRKLRSLRFFNFNTLVCLLRLYGRLLLWFWLSKMIYLWFCRFYWWFWFLSRRRLLIRRSLMMKILILLLRTFCDKTLFDLNLLFLFFYRLFIFIIFCFFNWILIRVLKWMI